MQISPDVYLVGSGMHGIDLSESLDCNVYVFDSGESYVMFDAGVGINPERILQVCDQDGLELKKPYHLFLTHGHGDYSAGGSFLRELFDLKIYGSSGTAERVVNGADLISLPDAIKAGVYPSDFVYQTYEIDQVVEDGETLTFGELDVFVILTPGHSDDHTCYLVNCQGKRYLLSGDAIFHGGRIILQNTYDCRVPETIASIRRLSEFDFDVLLPGHLLFSLNNGKQHVDMACEVLDRMGCPPSVK